MVMVVRKLGLSSFSSMNLTQQMLLTLSEELVGELPSVRDNLPKTISVELADKAGEIVVLEVVGEEIAGELRGTPDDESGVVFAPGDNVIGGGIVDQLVSLGEERGWDRLVRVQRK